MALHPSHPLMKLQADLTGKIAGLDQTIDDPDEWGSVKDKARPRREAFAETLVLVNRLMIDAETEERNELSLAKLFGK